MWMFMAVPYCRTRPFSTGVFCFVITLTVVAIILLKQVQNPQLPNWIYTRDSMNLRQSVLREESSWSEKWIVITTIAPPTEDIKFVASLKGWKVVVVGDVKTPANWSFPNCDFLDIKRQKELNFHSAHIVPERSYTRKNIGYLYAIQHGAKVIYETDDDNRPTDILQRFDYGPTFSGLEFAGRHLFNPYHHFGQSTLWPRGFPLSGIGKESSRLYRMSQSMQTGLIQQGLVNGDPDMDAIFRLTRKRAGTDLDVHFDPVAPSVSVPRGVFSPFNSQNTLFHYGAFWGLLLPTTTTMRVCDIWRGYWAQRLLWEIDGRLAFYPPNAYQKRNSHSYLEDALEEDQMYKNTERLIDFLTDWQCDPKLSFFGCVETLISDLAAAGFLGQRDVDLTRAWLVDLSSLGYTEPIRKFLAERYITNKTIEKSPIFGNESIKLCMHRPANPNLAPTYIETNVIFYPVEQNAPMLQSRNQPSVPNLIQHLSTANDVCPHSNSLSYATDVEYTSKSMNFFDDILLILSFNFPNYYRNIRYLEAAYRPIFPNIVYCGPDHIKFQKAVKGMSNFQQLSFIEVDTSCGYLAYTCMLQALKIGYNVTGYLHVADDVLINPWNFVGMNKSRVWMTKEYNYPLYLQQDEQPWWFWWSLPPGKHAFDLIKKDVFNDTDIPSSEGLAEYLKNVTADQGYIMRGLSDVYYIPGRLERLAKHYLAMFYSRSLFLELAIPLFSYGLEPASDIELISGISIKKIDRDQKTIWDFFNSKFHMFHPHKLSNGTENFCATFMVALIKNVYRGR